MSREETDEAMRYVLELALVRDLRVSRGEARKMVNRWQAEIKAEAWDEGDLAGQVNANEHREHKKMQNPYRQEQDA